MTARLAFFILAVSLGQAQASDGQQPVQVLARQVEDQEWFSPLTYPVSISPRQRSILKASTGGVVKSIKVKLGDSVAQSGPVIAIERQQAGLQYRPAMIVSPIQGRLSQLFVHEGSVVSPGDKLATVVDMGSVIFEAQALAKDLEKLNEGMTGHILGPRGDKRAEVVITQLAPWVSPQTATGQVIMALTNPKTSPFTVSDNPAQVTFKIGQRQALSVPASLLSYQKQKPVVKVVGPDSKIEVRALKLGEQWGGQVEILEGLAPGDLVVENATKFLSAGQKVSVQTKKANQAGQKD